MRSLVRLSFDTKPFCDYKLAIITILLEDGSFRALWVMKFKKGLLEFFDREAA